MINCPDELKELYRFDYLPYRSVPVLKLLDLTFNDLNITVPITQIVDDSFSLEESICSQDDLKFGACESSIFKLKVANVTDSIKGQEFTLTQTVDGTYTLPLGKYTVYACPKEDDLIFKDITAYDRMTRIDTEVATWYNGLFPTGNESYQLAQFRASFLAYVGLQEDTTNLPLPNDSEMIYKTIDSPTMLSGRMVIEAIEEANGTFGHINRYGKFTHIVLDESFVDYPQNDYPSSDYPEDEPYEQIEPHMYIENSIKFEEYTVKMIDKLIIRQEENDVGAIYGTGTNAYVIQGNFLFYGKSAADLQRIAANIAKNIFNRGYRPYTAQLIGLPYVEVGDTVKYHTSDTVAGYVLSRTLKGIQALRDTYEAKGSEVQTEKASGTNYEIQQLKGKSFTIEKSVEGVKQTVVDLENSTDSKFEETATNITAEVNRAKETENALSGSINVLAGQVVLKVDSAGNVGYVELNASPDTKLTKITIKADNIDLAGYVTIAALNGSGTTVINGSNITTGTIDASKVNVTNLNADNIKVGTLTGIAINGVSISGATISSGYEAHFTNIIVRGTSGAVTDITGLSVETTFLTASTLNDIAVSEYATKSWVQSQFQPIGSYLVQSDLSNVWSAIASLNNEVQALKNA